MHPTPLRPRIAIVGAGASGLCQAVLLRRAGFDRLTIYERADQVGGTWRDNTYPGLHCDVPSRYYSFSFAQSSAWDRVFAAGAQIGDYLEQVADDFDLRRHLRLGTPVADAEWREETGTWMVTAGDGSTEPFDVLISATGVLRDPKIPDIQGLGAFAGPVFHSARWDHGVTVEGRRVGIIGTGSSGVQITTALAGVAEHVSLFARRPHWVLPLPNPRYPALVKLAHEVVPGLRSASRLAWQTLFEKSMARAATRPGVRRQVLQRACRAALQLEVRDPELRRRLTPADDPFCKRLILSGGFYRAVQRDDVSLVDERIDRIESEGVRTGDGVLHRLDVLVLATGFHSQRFMRPMQLTGRGGLTLDEAWADGPRGYLTVGVAGFPNVFTLMGPHSPVGNQSLVEIAETQAAYVVRAVRKIAQERVSMAPTVAATDAFHREVADEMPRTAWTAGCDSWYLDDQGRPTLWPFLPEDHRRRLRRLRLRDYDIRPLPAPVPAGRR